jgi:glycine cleavage system aminomethyltransferase T/glycine/D-amino acid oxidase-like deaminating enzyme
MKSHARAVIIGGGIAGCSVAYHLTRLGWVDVVLVEKGELTSGSTWHSVGNTPMFTTSLNILKLLKYSVDLYQSLEQETGQAVGFHRVGSLRLATSPELVDWYKAIAGMAKIAGVPFEIIGAQEAKILCPIFSEAGVLCASLLPADGYADPSAITQALAAGARGRGAEICTETRVEALARRKNGEWEVVTDRGLITAEVVVNAAGQWAAEIGKMAGVALPIISMEHQYLVTDSLEEIWALAGGIPILRDPERALYVRQELDGLLFGIFERNPRPWAVGAIPRGFGQQLLPPDISRIEDCVAAAVERVPLLQNAPIKKIVNGPEAYTPDGRCLMGPVPGLRNFFVLAGFSNFGIANGGGAGKYLAEWIVDGQPSDDMWELDVCRFGPYAAAKRYLIATACETYEKDYAVVYPLEERPAGRPLRTSPIYDRLKAQGAVYAARAGWERPLWFAPAGVEPAEALTFRRPNWFKQVGQECWAVRERAGVLDQTSLGKFEISGPGATAFLERLCANRIGREIGRIVVTQMLNEQGGIQCDLTVTRLAEQRYFLVTAAALATHHSAWIERHLPRDGSVWLDDVTARYGCLSLSGPRSRDVLLRITDDDISDEGLPFMTFKEIHVGCAPARALRLSYIGELGWEFYLPIEVQRYVYELILGAGQESGIVNYGYRALASMRLEKGHRLWGADLSAKTTPYEAGLDRFVALDKGGFLGCPALVRQRQADLQRTLATLIVESRELVPHGQEPVWADGGIRGCVTSGDYGHVVGKTIAMAYLPPACAEPGASLEVQMLGERFRATVVSDPIYDPHGVKVRAA